VVRREQPDPLLLQTVSARLARLLAETAPPQAEQPHAPGPPGADGTTADLPASSEPPSRTPLESVDELPPPRFRRLHVGVVAALLLAGLLWSGWSLLRARPVALATPPTVVVSTGQPPATARPAPGATPAVVASPSPSGTTAGRVVVHVLGAVRRPGLVRLSGQARVQDAIDAAGGLTRRADPAELNLAQLLQDGQQVVVGTASRPDGEVRDGSGSGGGGTAGSRSSPRGPGPSVGGVLDLNEADATQLEELPGVGPVTAGAIVAWRTEHGRFGTIEELQEVDGIGPKTYARIAPHVRV
jgi:competence protein ComEA